MSLAARHYAHAMNLLVLAAFCLLGAFGVWSYQLALWLLDAVWRPVTLLGLLAARPQLELKGVETVLIWLLDLNAGLLLAMVCAALIAVRLRLDRLAMEREARKKDFFRRE